MARPTTTNWIEGRDRRPPALVLLVIGLAIGIAAIDLVLMLGGG